MSITIEITGPRSLWQAVKLLWRMKRKPRYHYRPDGREKVRYDDQEDAIKAQDAFKRKYGRDLDAYHCPLCQGWHLGGAR